MAVLLALRALATLPGVLSVLRNPSVPLSGLLLGDVLASTLLPLALATLFWWGAPAIATRLLAPGAAPGVWANQALEATVFRAVGLYLTVVAAAGLLFWLVTLLAQPLAGFAVPLFLETLAELGLGLALLRWAPSLARWLSARRG